jgi:FkbM family methyltransferase
MQAPRPFLFERLLVSFARRWPVRRGKLRVVDAFWRRAVGARGTQRLARLKYGNFSMPCNISEMLQRQFYFFGTYFLEEDILDCWREAAKGAKIVFDVGANAGIYSLAALASEPEVVVYAFEPTPEVASRLRETAALNKLDKLHVQEVAVSDMNDYAKLMRWRGEGGTNEGMNFISSVDANCDPDRVTTVRLDDFCSDHGIRSIDLLKVDVQGHEYRVLLGAENLIRTGCVRTIFLELNWLKNSAASPARQCVSLLGRYGYQFSVPGSRLQWSSSGDWMNGLSDIVARQALRSEPRV